MSALLDELVALRRENEALKGELAHARAALSRDVEAFVCARTMGLQSCAAIVAVLLARHRVLTYPVLEDRFLALRAVAPMGWHREEIESPRDYVKQALYHLRRWLKPRGLSVSTRWGTGVEIAAPDQARLKALLGLDAQEAGSAEGATGTLAP